MGKKLKFKYESFSGSDFLKTAFMVCYRFFRQVFFPPWGRALLKRQETFSISCVEKNYFLPKTAVALVKFHQII